MPPKTKARTDESYPCDWDPAPPLDSHAELGNDVVIEWGRSDGTYRILRRPHEDTVENVPVEILGEGRLAPWQDGFELVPLKHAHFLTRAPKASSGTLWKTVRVEDAFGGLSLEPVREGDVKSFEAELAPDRLGGGRISADSLGGSERVFVPETTPLPATARIAEGLVEPNRRFDPASFGGAGTTGPSSGRGATRILYVDVAHKESQDGSGANPYRTISGALAVARRGDVIVVASGLYRENLTLKRGVRLLSGKTGGAIIHGGANWDGGKATVLGADRATIEGFVIAGGYDGIRCDGTSPHIVGNIVRGNYGVGGIVCTNGSKAKIYNNTVLGNLGNSTDNISCGIYVEGASPEIGSNIVTGNDIGYLPKSGSPDERGNDFWGNLTDYGGGAVPGPGSFSDDPRFMDIEVDDFRLAPSSPCLDSGDPRSPYHRNIGAFYENGGHKVSLAAQEYFVECILHAKFSLNFGFEVLPATRYVTDPVFYFPPGQQGRGVTETKEMLKSLVPTMTAGAHQARFHAASTKPNRCEVITVTFDGNNGQPFLRSSVEPDCFQTASGGHIPKRSKAISGGHVRIYSSILSEGYMPDGYPSVRNISLLIHELGHAFGLAHSFRGKHSVSRGYFEPVITHSPIEIEAFELLYDLPVGTKLEQMITDEKISRAVLTPFPRIDDLRGVRESSWYSVPRKVNGVTKYSVEAGSEIILTGSRLTLRFGQDYDYDFGRPSNYNHPVAVFAGGESFKMNTKAVYQEATGSGGYSRNLRLRIPSGAESGWFYIRARGLESNPIWLEIV